MPVEAVKLPEPTAVPPARPKEITIELGTPVQAHGEMIRKLTFRSPTGGDIMAMGEGYPIITDYVNARITPNPPVMGAMMSVLAAVPPSTIKALDSEDWVTCSNELLRFFLPSRPTQY